MAKSRFKNLNLGLTADPSDSVDTSNRAVNALSASVRDSLNLSGNGTIDMHGYKITTSGISSAPTNNPNAKSGTKPVSEMLAEVKEDAEFSEPSLERAQSSTSQSSTDTIPAFVGKTISSEDTFIIGNLGSGQNGVVQKAVYLPEMEIVALKAVNLYDKAKRHQMIKELTAFANVQAPCVVRLVGAYTHKAKGSAVLALEYMNRGSLKQVVDRYGAVKEPVLKHIVKLVS